MCEVEANATPIEPYRSSAGKGTLGGVLKPPFAASPSSTRFRLFELKIRMSTPGVPATDVGAVEKPPDDWEE